MDIKVKQTKGSKTSKCYFMNHKCATVAVKEWEEEQWGQFTQVQHRAGVDHGLDVVQLVGDVPQVGPVHPRHHQPRYRDQADAEPPNFSVGGNISDGS